MVQVTQLTMAQLDADPQTLLSQTFARIFSDPIKFYQINAKLITDYESLIQADMNCPIISDR
jgi:hypothetical protein